MNSALLNEASLLDEASEFSSRAAAAEHIAVEASRLAKLASRNDFPLLAYLIDMAVLEAWREASEGVMSKPHYRPTT